MYHISSQDGSWFPVFDWRGEPVFHKHLKWSFPQQYVGERDSVISFSFGMYRERPDSKESLISLQWLKFSIVFHLTRWRDVWIPCETIEKAVVLRLIGQGESHQFDNSRVTRNSMLQRVTIPEYFWKWIGIPISLFQIENEPRSPASPPVASVLSCYA